MQIQPLFLEEETMVENLKKFLITRFIFEIKVIDYSAPLSYLFETLSKYKYSLYSYRPIFIEKKLFKIVRLIAQSASMQIKIANINSR